MNRIHRFLAGILPAALLAAAPLHAQETFRSDVTGPIVTGSGVAGMGYPVVPVRDIENALFRNVNGRSAFRTRAVADAVASQAAEAQRAACSGTLQRPASWRDSLALPVDAQRIVCGLLAKPGMDTDEARRVLAVLRGGLEGLPGGDAADALVRALAGLTSEELRFVDERQRFVAGARWEEAFRAYDAYLEVVPAEALDPPPPVLVVIGALLEQVVEAGLAASER